MMHHTRYDDVDHLKAELDQERRYKETIEWSNTELERSITELEAYLTELETNSRAADDNEWKVRFESQTALNKQMQEQKDWLETELAEARRRLTTGTYPEAMNFNLDALNEPELLRLVKHLERMRNDFYSTLRDTEWKLDKESKEFHHFDEMRRHYKAELKHANHTIERMRLGTVLDPSGAVSPIYPPGYFRWLDSHTPMGSYSGRDGPMGSMPPGMGMGMGGGGGGGGGTGKKGKKQGGGGSKSPAKTAGGDPMGSPTRSKSRADKKSKKKESPPAEEAAKRGGGGGGGGGGGTRRGSRTAVMKESETETGNVTDDVSAAGDLDAKEKQSNASSTGDTFTITVTKEEAKPAREGSDKERNEDGG